MARTSYISSGLLLGVLSVVMANGVALGQQLELKSIEPDVAGFKARIVPLFEDYCLDCHDNKIKKGNFSLEGIDSTQINGDGLETWRLIREQVTFGDMPPKDKLQPTPDERKAMIAWIRDELRKGQLPGVPKSEKLALPQYGNYVDHDALFGARLDRVYPAPPRLWRLRPDIYDSTMPRLGDRIEGLANGLNELDDPEFKDYAASYFLDEAATAPLLGNAKKIAESMIGPRAKDRVFRELASDDGPPKPEAVRDAIGVVFRKVLDRGATAEETDRFQAFFDKTAAAAGHKTAAKMMITAVLMQPEVLYRRELGDGKPDEYGRVRLSPREIAFALSYALSNEPIDEFMKSAAAGGLATSEQVGALVRSRLADDSRGQGKNPRVLQFFREYFNYPFARDVFKDKPEGGDHDPQRLVADLEATIRDVLRADQNVFAELLTTRKYYVDANFKNDKRDGVILVKGHERWSPYHTAYNLSPDWKWSAETQPVEFPRDERAGVLTHPAWLAAWSGNFENHPVQRGKWIRTHLLGGSVPDVPIGVDARVPEREHTTFRDRLKIATEPAECWRCHKKMNPLGVAFERYDHYGRFQRLDAGQPVDASALISRTGVAELDGKKVAGPIELVELLAKSEYAEQVFVRYVFRYFMGRNETIGDANTLQDAHKAYRDSGGSFRELVVSLLSSDSFLLRQTSAQAGSKP